MPNEPGDVAVVENSLVGSRFCRAPDLHLGGKEAQLTCALLGTMFSGTRSSQQQQGAGSQSCRLAG